LKGPLLCLAARAKKEYIMEDLARHGVRFDNKSRYTLAQL
jgi:hypothetical protein